jgi:carboxylate-amine ligase
MENKFRAVRYGLGGKLIDFGKEIEVPETELIREYLEFVKDEVEELESTKAIGYIHQMLEQGSGADRQLKVWRETGSLRAVVDFMAAETKAGL